VADIFQGMHTDEREEWVTDIFQGTHADGTYRRGQVGVRSDGWTSCNTSSVIVTKNFTMSSYALQSIHD
jgi:hypothetical protein